MFRISTEMKRYLTGGKLLKWFPWQSKNWLKCALTLDELAVPVIIAPKRGKDALAFTHSPHSVRQLTVWVKIGLSEADNVTLSWSQRLKACSVWGKRSLCVSHFLVVVDSYGYNETMRPCSGSEWPGFPWQCFTQTAYPQGGSQHASNKTKKEKNCRWSYYLSL